MIQLIDISLKVTPVQLMAIASLLNADTRAVIAPTSNTNLEKVTLDAKVVKKSSEPTIEHVPVTIPTAGKKVKMAGFGRTQVQIDEFTENEEERFEKRSEEELLKEQRKEERDAKAAEKKIIADEKKAEEDHFKKEIANIKKAVEDKAPEKATTVIKKPWEQ